MNFAAQKHIMTKTHLNIDLISGVFEKEDTLRVLTNLLRQKIQFHELRIFSNEERGKEDSLHSKARVKELRAQLQLLEEYMKSKDQTEAFFISSSIILHPLEKEQLKTA